MKHLRKVITLFAFIFIAGIFITIITVNSSLNKTEPSNEAVKIKKDTLYLKIKEKTF